MKTVLFFSENIEKKEDFSVSFHSMCIVMIAY